VPVVLRPLIQGQQGGHRHAVAQNDGLPPLARRLVQFRQVSPRSLLRIAPSIGQIRCGATKSELF